MSYNLEKYYANKHANKEVKMSNKILTSITLMVIGACWFDKYEIRKLKNELNNAKADCKASTEILQIKLKNCKSSESKEISNF